MTPDGSPAVSPLLTARQQGARRQQVAKRITRRLKAHGIILTDDEAQKAAAIELGHERADYKVSTPTGASWPEGSRHMVWLWPTQSHSRGGLSFSPSKRAARVKLRS